MATTEGNTVSGKTVSDETVSDEAVSGDEGAGETMTSYSETMTGDSESVTGETVAGVGDGGDVSSQLAGNHGGDASSSTVDGSFVGLSSVNRLPSMVFSSVHSLTLELGSLVMVFAGGVDGGACVVGGFDVSVDGGTLEITWRNGGDDGAMADGKRRSVTYSQGTS